MGSYGVGRFQLAAAAGDRLEVVDPSGIDRGPWPIALRVRRPSWPGLVAWLVARLLLRVARRRTA